MNFTSTSRLTSAVCHLFLLWALFFVVKTTGSPVAEANELAQYNEHADTSLQIEPEAGDVQEADEHVIVKRSGRSSIVLPGSVKCYIGYVRGPRYRCRGRKTVGVNISHHVPVKKHRKRPTHVHHHHHHAPKQQGWSQPRGNGWSQPRGNGWSQSQGHGWSESQGTGWQAEWR